MDYLATAIRSQALKLGGKDWGFSFDNRQLFNGDPEALRHAAGRIWELIKQHEPEVLIGKGVAAYPLLVAVTLAAPTDKPPRILFVRDKRKETGTFRKLVEGPPPAAVKGKRAVFIDDIINRGDTYRFCLKALKEDGFEVEVVALACLVDFWHGSRQLRAVGMPVEAVYRRHDLGLTREDSGLPWLLDDVKWHLHVHHRGRDYMPVKSPPVLVEGRVYIGNDDTHQYCYDAETGDLLWRYESARPSLKGNVCVSQVAKGKVYWTTYDGVVRCADAVTGEHVWATKADLNLHSAPCLDLPRTRLFLGTEFDKQPTLFGLGDIIALDSSNGHELWRFKTRNMVPATPAYCERTNMVVCGSNDFHVYLLDADTGTCRAKLPTKGEVKGKCAVVDGRAIAVTVTGNVYGIDLRARCISWERNIGKSTIHAYPLIVDDMVIVANQANHVMALDVVTGAVRWLTTLRGSVPWGPIAYGGILLMTTTNGHVVLLNAKTGEKLATDRIDRTARVSGAVIYAPPAYDGTHLVIATNNKGILCYELDLDEVLA